MVERRALALLPGLLCDRRLWESQIDGLSDLVDPWVADFTSQDTIGEMARSVLSAMPERFAVAGLSMGGYVALEIMRQAPERVERLALLDTKADSDTEEQTLRRRGLIELAQKGDFQGATSRLLPLFVHESRLEDHQLLETIKSMAKAVGKDAFLRQQAAIMGRPDSVSTLAQIGCPTLVLCGREDALAPVDKHTSMAAGIRKSNLVVIEDCGHLATMERPQAVNAAMRTWLETGI